MLYECIRDCFHGDQRYRLGQFSEFPDGDKVPPHFEPRTETVIERVVTRAPLAAGATPAFAQADTSWAAAANAPAAPDEPAAATEELVKEEDITPPKGGKAPKASKR